MIAYIKGIVEDINEENVVIEVQNIGYNIKISSETASRMPGIGELVKLYTYTLVKEDAFSLYGFLSRDELELFKLCITVSGIGPKVGQAILSVMDPDSLRFAIMSADVKLISKAPGVGKRTAERLILELKGKISIEDTSIGREMVSINGAVPADNEQKREAIDALVALGYGQSESMKAVNSVENIESLDSGALLKAALKKLI